MNRQKVPRSTPIESQTTTLAMPDSKAFHLREREFVRFLAALLSAHPQYADVQTEPGTRQGRRPDLTANRRRDGVTQRLVIEVKAAPFMSPSRTATTIRQIDGYRNAGPFDVAALFFPGQLRESDRAAFEAARIEVWDLDHVATTFAGEIQSQRPSPIARLFLQSRSSPLRTEADEHIRRLRDCPPGNSHWREFQIIIKEAFEYLFVPPLEQAMEESADASGANRRDVILPNYTPEGFWKSMKDTYNADYIVVEAKNHKGPISKQQALQVANYLKPHGAGQFAIIAARNGASRSCNETIREQWITYGKMIVLVTEDHVEDMLRAKGTGRNPEDVLVNLIRKFRLSL